jgi:hypothetical protein
MKIKYCGFDLHMNCFNVFMVENTDCFITESPKSHVIHYHLLCLRIQSHES